MSSNPVIVADNASKLFLDGAVVAFLCSEQAEFVTGVQLHVDGGAYAGEALMATLKAGESAPSSAIVSAQATANPRRAGVTESRKPAPSRSA